MLTSPSSRPLEADHVVPHRTLLAVAGQTVAVPNPERLVHLQFRRFAGCPVCTLHLHSFARRHDEIEAAGISEVVFFHATAGELAAHTADLPFAVVGDPDKRLYAEFGVGSSARALLDPRAWGPMVRAVLFSLWGIVREGRPAPAANPTGGRLGLPADFLIAADGRVLACKYGEYVDDQWSVDDLLELAAAVSRPGRPAETAATPT